MGARGPLPMKIVPSLTSVGAKPDTSTAATAVALAKPVKPEALDETASAIWDRIVDELWDAGMVSALDGPAIEQAIRMHLIFLAASDVVLEEGPTIEDHKNDRLAKHPAVQVARDASSAYLALAKELGLTYVARARVAASKEAHGGNASNPFSALG